VSELRQKVGGVVNFPDRPVFSEHNVTERHSMLSCLSPDQKVGAENKQAATPLTTDFDFSSYRIISYHITFYGAPHP